ncbi:hypothetical protein BD324DRAFT_619910 [Kockovaella imperatae]|uniref:Histone acetyltransferase n=1 Tax=Kockovaella imperatae TaxID=4999 RepID=A0A1Y1UJM9_9TREE|nr:hypothetical protein BD324DRAFT_619910 [Kockovaella imperatae]ORX38192.1 hypothetical protein BD324DRAFT_619910 [Kockovaella imperatae]
MPSLRGTPNTSRLSLTPSRHSQRGGVVNDQLTNIKGNASTLTNGSMEIDPALLGEDGQMDIDGYAEEDAEGEEVDEEVDADADADADAEGEVEQVEMIGQEVNGADGPFGGDFEYDPPSQSSRGGPSRPGRPSRASSSQRRASYDEFASYPDPLRHSPAPAPIPPMQAAPRGRGRPPKNASLSASRSAPKLSEHFSGTPKTLAKGKGKQIVAKAGPIGPAKGSKGSGQSGEKFQHDFHCSFCLGTDEANRQGQPERMLSCARCGRSGHPTCLNIISKRLLKTVREYEWCCIECKTCEICGIKGDDNRLMFCDGCDRGWHSYCLNPPLVKPPKGQWLCPTCNPPSSSSSHPNSKSAPNLSSLYKGKGKGRASDLSLSHSLSQVTPTRGRGRPRKYPIGVLDPLINGVDAPGSHGPKIKLKSGKKRQETEDQSEDMTPGVNGNKMKIRLRIPSGGRQPVEVESEEEKIPFGGIITGPDADTTKTSIRETDQAAFEKALQAAESKLSASSNGPGVSGDPTRTMTPASPAPSTNGSSFPPTASKNGQMNGHFSTATPLANRSLRDRLLNQSMPTLGTPGDQTPTNGSVIPGTPLHMPSLSGAQKIKMIRFGVFEIDTWFSAPYPEEYQHVPDGRLWICEFCFKYMKSGFVAERHRLKCKARHPPGDEIYRDGSVSVFEVDGRKNKIYCQNLCLLAKMFLDSKTLYYDVEPFLFYVMTEVDDMGARFVGYFSKEKRSLDNNVSCIMTLPVRQRKGWGQLLIDFSYLLSKKEERVGGPERPLSGLGEVTYKKYWSLAIMRFLRDCTIPNPTLEDISAETSMTLEDIYMTLKYENMINVFDTPPREIPSGGADRSYGRPRGRGRGRPRSLGNRRPPRPNSATPAESEDKDKVVLPERYEITWDADYIHVVLKKHDSRGYLTLRPERLKYHPFLVSRNAPKPPGALARATLMANNPNQRREKGDETGRHINGKVEPPRGHAEADASGGQAGKEDAMETPEKVNAGQDQATLELVARLSGGTGRNLRHRTTSVVFDPDDQPSSKRLRTSRSATSLRGRRMAEEQGDDHDDDEAEGEVNEEEDDPLRIGKGMNGTPKRGARETRSRESILKQPNGSDGSLRNGKNMSPRRILRGDSELREETEEVEEPVEEGIDDDDDDDEWQVDDVDADADAEGEEEDEEWVE